ncbi:MAG: hypothetical protein IPH53_07680 [Flavobacteriales bacterium]|nr:hypothetical protein [Flavobacteriales bacterium]
MACDDIANVYLTGTVRGQVDWGNGVVSDAIASVRADRPWCVSRTTERRSGRRPRCRAH